MIRTRKPKVQLNVRISPALNAQLEKLAIKADVTKAAIVIGALKTHVERAGK
jgi:predicted transcriptional regulator